MIITIKLQNFRKFKNCTFTFDKQLSLISGKSGQGKTTIFMAIIFALTGEGKKVTSFGTSKCSVTLNIQNPELKSQITITRTKCPNRLLVTTRSSDPAHDEKSYESEEAQRIIDTFFPQYHIGYMSQRVEDKAFILMSPMDKLRFVQKMAFDDTLYSDMNRKCRDLIRERKEDLQLTSRERETTQNMLRDFDENQVLDQCDGDEIDETTDFGSLIQKKEKELTKLNGKLSKTQELIKIKTQLRLDINKLEKNLANGCSFQMKSRIEEIQSQLQQLYSHRQQEERFRKEQAKLIELASPSPPSLVTSDMIHVARRFDELQKSVRDMTGVSSKLDKIQKVIDTSAIPLTCPECETNLSLWLTPTQKNAKVMLVKGKQENCKTITYEEARSLEEQKCKLLASLTNFESQKKQLEDMQKQHPDSANKSSAELAKAKKKYDEYMKQVAICDSHKRDVTVDLPNHEELEHELRVLKKNWETCIVLEEKRSHEKSIVIKDDSDALIQQIKETQDALDKVKSDQTRAKMRKYKEKLVQLSDKERVLNVSYPRAVKLQTLIKQAEKQSIEEIISQINAHAHIYMDYFLDNISVTLLFEKGKSLDTTRLNVDVRQDGHVSDLSSLSGGEIARVVLAFTIALAEINNVKLLLLDECVASLDQETTTSVISAIRDNYKGTVLAIAHQTTTGVFDYVLELNE
jgi:exonuclease SbcC